MAPAATTRRAPSRSNSAGEQDQRRAEKVVDRDGRRDLGDAPAMALLQRHQIDPRAIEPDSPAEQRDQEARRDHQPSMVRARPGWEVFALAVLPAGGGGSLTAARIVAGRFRTWSTVGVRIRLPGCVRGLGSADELVPGGVLDRRGLRSRPLARDPAYDGLFFTGVRTTRIYCRPICPVSPAKSGTWCSSPPPPRPSAPAFAPAYVAAPRRRRAARRGTARRRPWRVACA